MRVPWTSRRSNQSILKEISPGISLEGMMLKLKLQYFGHLTQRVQFLSCVQCFATPWIVAHQASLSYTISWSLLKLMSIESLMPSNHFILCHPLLLLPSIFPSIRVFQISQFFASGGQSIGVSASTSILPMNIQD